MCKTFTGYSQVMDNILIFIPKTLKCSRPEFHAKATHSSQVHTTALTMKRVNFEPAFPLTAIVIQTDMPKQTPCLNIAQSKHTCILAHMSMKCSK